MSIFYSLLFYINGDTYQPFLAQANCIQANPAQKKTNKLPASEAKPPPRRRGAAGGITYTTIAPLSLVPGGLDLNARRTLTYNDG